eukprot:GABV01003464.1.p1 GENE.GABV01003464.1~~GABV01003464.1.p1  ORF type:complete len:106 (+),score=32.39 GABV01003464.1:227-544(+)
MQFPQSGPKRGLLPQLVWTLSSAVRRLGGCKTEGIFRISAPSGELEAVKNAFSNGDYRLDGVANCHVPAALLKDWLRGLKDPLIPREMYDECTNLAKDKRWIQRT